MKKIVADIGRDHRLAQELWGTGLYDARLLASLIDEPEKVTKVQMDRWARQFDSQAICDNCCFNLFHATQFSWGRCVVWTDRKEEFVKKAGFTLMGALADFEPKADDSQFHRFIPIIERCGNDDRNAVPHGAFPCTDGEWVAFSCWSDGEFATLARLLGKPDLARDERFAHADGRRRNRHQLEELISVWTRQHSARDAAERLQECGLAAYPVVTIAGLFSDPQLGARRHWRVRRHPEIGDQTYCFPGFDFEEAPGDIVSAAPCLGADNDFVFRELVGVSEAEMQTYTDNGVFG